MVTSRALAALAARCFVAAAAMRLQASTLGSSGPLGHPGGVVQWLRPSLALPASWREFLSVEGLIGEGALARVYRCRLHDGEAGESVRGTPVAAKVLRLDVSGGITEQVFHRERRYLERFQGPSFINLLKVEPRAPTRQGDVGMFLMELADMDLVELIHLRQAGHPAVTEDLMLKLIVQILRGLAELEAARCVHGDLAPTNVLVVGDWRQGNCSAKLSDFGLARCADDVGTVTRRGLLGTSPYIAPEYFFDRVDNPEAVLSAEVWSAGVLFAEMLLGGLPKHWPKDASGLHTWFQMFPWRVQSMHHHIGDRIQDRRLCRLLLSMLDKTPDRRPTMAKALRLAESIAHERGLDIGTGGSASGGAWEPSKAIALGRHAVPAELVEAAEPWYLLSAGVL